MKRIDAHIHLYKGNIPDMLETMDICGLEYAVNLTWVLEEDEFLDLVKYTKDITGGRIVTLSNFGYDKLDMPGYAESLVERFKREIDAGVRGLKVLKRLGLRDRYTTGEYVRVDDERLDPLWEMAGEAGLPVLIHTADSIPAWMPLDENNPRFEQYSKNKTYYYAEGDYFPRLELLAQRERIVERHPDTIFVNAHWGCYPEDTDHLVSLLNKYPNFYTDTEPSKVQMTPLGKDNPSRQQVMIDYADRMIYGTDLMMISGEKRMDHEWNKDMYDGQYEYFSGTSNDGLNLPEDILRKFYCDNAVRVYGLGT